MAKKIRITISLSSSDDADLIAVMQGIPAGIRSQVIRQCLAAVLLPGGYRDLIDTVRDLENTVARLQVSDSITPATLSEPAETPPSWSMADQWDQALRAFDSE